MVHWQEQVISGTLQHLGPRRGAGAWRLASAKPFSPTLSRPAGLLPASLKQAAVKVFVCVERRLTCYLETVLKGSEGGNFVSSAAG